MRKKRITATMLKAITKRLFGPKGGPSVPEASGEQLDRLIAEGNALEDAGRLQEAIELYQQAVRLAPENPKGALNLGIALTRRGDVQQAEAAFEKTLQLDPWHPFGNYNFARLCYLQNDLKRAEELVTKSLLGKPDFRQALVLLSNVLDDLDRPEEALAVLERLLQLSPGDTGTLFNHAVISRKTSRLEDAERSLRRILAIDPADMASWGLLARVMVDHGLGQEALQVLAEIDPSLRKPFSLRSEELFLMNCDEDLPAVELFRRHVDFGRDMEKDIPMRFHTYAGSAQVNRRLRVGYVSSDLKVHPVSLFLTPLLEKLDRERFEVFCYSSAPQTDHVTAQLRALFAQWRDVADLSDAELAQTIHDDAIDLLVDLGGHSSRTRLASFAQKPAPIQISWLGYLNTTGLTRVDYRICDAGTDPLDVSGPLHTEQLVHMPHSQWCYRPFITVPLSVAPPNAVNHYITFGSFNAAVKVTDHMVVRWARVLQRVPYSRLLFAGINSQRKRQAIRSLMAQEGIDGGRLEFSPRADLEDYFKLIASVDIALDCFPYGGGTTTFDCLWMGVPVVTATGDIPASRSAASILSHFGAASIMSHLGLTDWVAPSIDDYVETAVARTLDVDPIARLREVLRARMLASPLMDEAGFAKDMGAVYLAMWSAYCAEQGQ